MLVSIPLLRWTSFMIAQITSPLAVNTSAARDAAVVQVVQPAGAAVVRFSQIGLIAANQ